MKRNIKEEIDRELSYIQADEQKLQNILERRPEQHRGISKARVALCVMLLALLASVPVSASVLRTIRGTTRITEENRELVGQKQYAVSEDAEEGIGQEHAGTEMPEVSPYMTAEAASEQTDGIIREIGLDQEGNPCLYDGQIITVIELNEASEGKSWKIEPLLSGNGDVTVFARGNGEGWYLKEGQTLTLRYRIDPSEVFGGDVENGETMSVGYICNHTFQSAQLHVKAKEFSYTLRAPEDGVYYFYNENFSAGYIYLSEGEIAAGEQGR